MAEVTVVPGTDEQRRSAPLVYRFDEGCDDSASAEAGKWDEEDEWEEEDDDWEEDDDDWDDEEEEEWEEEEEDWDVEEEEEEDEF